MKAIIIARVSTEEQREAGNSLPAQTARLEKYCQIKSFEVIEKFSFDESAYKDNRDEFDRILAFIQDQKEVIAVCFDKVDRLSRNVFDKRVSLLYEEALKDKIELHFTSEGQVINSQISAVEKFQFGMSLGLAKYYSDAISDNVKRATEQKLRKGEWPQHAPLGYKNITKDDEKKDIIVDEYWSKIIQKAYELYGTSAYSMELVRKKLKEDYGVNWSKGLLDKILKCHFYYGVMVWKGKMYPHRYPPLITQTLFDRVQQIKAGFHKKKFKYAGLPFIYRGLLRCSHCGLAVTPERKIKANGRTYHYYHCTQYNGKHGAEWLTEEDITQQLGQVFKGLQVPEDILEDILGTLNEVHKNKSDFRETQLSQLTKEKDTTAKMIENLYVDKLKGRITDDQYDKFYQSFRDQISEIDAKLALLQDAEDNYYITAKYLLELANRAYDLFISSEVEERRQIIKLVLQNLTIEGKKVRYNAIKPFDTILNCSERQRWLRDKDSDLDRQFQRLPSYH